MRTTVEHRELENSRRTRDEEIVPVGRLADPAEARADEMAERARTVAVDYRHGSIRRSPAGGSSAAVDGIGLRTDALDRASGGAQPLAAVQREHLESAYDTSLDDVRVHTGAAAGRLAAGIGASAFTRGNDIYFGAGEYRPDTDRGAHVLAHEVAHTLESSSSGGGGESVRRFPAMALTSPVPWKNLTASVFRPGEGVSGGVYILSSKDKNGQIKKVVAKPVFSGKNGIGATESPEAAVFGDRALRQLFGINTPESRFASKGSAEYADLLSLCAPYAPAKVAYTLGPPEVHAVPGLNEADAFVIMGAVDGSSLGGLSEKSATDANSFDLLQRTLFDPAILEQFGKLAIADIVLGNGDRVSLGKTNLGNVMVSSANGKLDLWAIDTLAQLPKYLPSLYSRGVDYGMNKSSADDIKNGPVAVLDEVFKAVADRIKGGVDPRVADSPNAPHTVLQQRYSRDKQIVLGYFTQGWNAALQQAAMLSAGAAPRKAGAKDELEHLTGSGLRQNLKLMGGIGSGKTHDQSAKDGLSDVVVDYVKSIDWKSLSVPSDALMPAGFALPPAEVLNAREPVITAIDPATYVGHGDTSSQGFRNYASGFPGLVASAHSQVDQSVEPTKQRRKGMKKVEVPRNRNQLGHFVANSQAVAIGTLRLADTLALASKTADELAMANGLNFGPGEGGAVADAMRRLDVMTYRLRQTTGTYGRIGPIAGAGLQAAPNVANKVSLLKVQGRVGPALKSATAKLDRISKKNLTAAAAKIT